MKPRFFSQRPIRGLFFSLFLLPVAVGASSLAAQSSSGAQPDRLPLIPFDGSIEDLIQPAEDVDYKLVQDGESKALRITTPAGRDWPGLTIRLPEETQNLAYYDYISVDIHNVDNKDIDLYFRVDNPGADGRKNCISERAYLQPGQRTTLTIPIKRVSSSKIQLVGMLGFPQGLYPDGVGLDPTQIVAVLPFTGKKTQTSNTFEISNIYASGKYTEPAWLEMTPEQFFPMVDRYGQFIHKEWPDKVKSDADLHAQREAEAKQLAQDKGPAEWNQWGGWANGPKLEASGHFRTVKHQGKWWLVDPAGNLFFSTGLTCVTSSWGATPLEDREHYFAHLPEKEGELGKFYGQTYRQWAGYYAGKAPATYDFSRANLLTKYGPDWKDKYGEVVHKRLRAWGINTIGNWSEGAIQRMSKTPYTLTFFYEIPKLNKRSSGFPDVLDPGFEAAVRKGAEQFLKGTMDDPYCIGYFVDNEMPWGGATSLAQTALGTPADSPAKQRMVGWLKEKYSSISALNRAWGTVVADWPALEAETKLKPTTEAATADLTAFTELIAETYFKTIHDVLEELAPNKLYLGCRSVGDSLNIARPAAKYCDVMSYNRYAHSAADLALPQGIDAPVIIGEFHFAGMDRGLFWGGLIAVEDQEARAKAYQKYVQSALDHPNIVGAHWFQYGDEPVAGRGDGENAQCGFVDVCDTPYAQTVAASRELAETMYSATAGKR